ncbi:MAG TPA: cell division protein FtsA [Candidatus Babeliales bacterium]|nr:cell division protein FtsA [Candidatus Babeliales bacterium]
MAKISLDNVIVAIDVGTTKICVVVAQQLDQDRVEVIGIGKAPSDGLSKGVVVDIARTIHSIKTAVKAAEIMAGLEIESACIGISGAHIQSKNSTGVTPITRGQVRQSDIENAIASAQAIPIPQGQQILHVLPHYFVIDSQTRVQDPLGMHGIRLEVQAHIIFGAVASVQNLVTCCERAGVKVSDIILEQLASADAVLSADERELGVGVLDIGGGTSDLALYQQGSIRHTMVLPVAGNHFTNDVAVGLRTTITDAERIKREYGMACIDLMKKDDLIEIELVQGGQKDIIFLHELISILQPRAHELFLLIHEEIVKNKLSSFLVSGLVITGGGSLLRGMKESAQQIFSVPVRIGSPRLDYDLPESLNSPIYATGYGLIIHTLKKRCKLRQSGSQAPIAQRIFEKMQGWILDFF